MSKRECREVFFPHSIQRLDDGRCIILNKRYSPLGVSTSYRGKYEEHESVSRLEISPSQAREMSWDGAGFDALGRLSLYVDGCRPTLGEEHMTAYLKRLAVLMHVRSEAQ